jgi:dTDP-4-amino-4,6-dideoxygalactose transaminase
MTTALIREVAKKITKRTKVIIPVDLYGQIYDRETINTIAQEHNVKVLEDACQAIGASRNGTMAGNVAHISVFSLYATKNITSGEGGMITTNNAEYARRCRLFRHHGQDENLRYAYLDMGYNYRTTDICSAIGIAQLEVRKLTERGIGTPKYITKGSISRGFQNYLMDGNSHCI